RSSSKVRTRHCSRAGVSTRRCGLTSREDSWRHRTSRMPRPERPGEAPPDRPAEPGWTAAILAGGESRRLGKGLKATLHLGGESVLDRQLALLGKVVGRTMIIANDPT